MSPEVIAIMVVAGLFVFGWIAREFVSAVNGRRFAQDRAHVDRQYLEVQTRLAATHEERLRVAQGRSATERAQLAESRRIADALERIADSAEVGAVDLEGVIDFIVEHYTVDAPAADGDLSPTEGD